MIKKLLMGIAASLIAAPAFAADIGQLVASGHGNDGCEYSIHEAVASNVVSNNSVSCIIDIQNEYVGQTITIENNKATIANLTDKLNEAETAVRNKTQQIADLNVQLTAITTDRDNWMDRSNTLESIARNLDTQVSNLEDELDTANATITSLNGQIDTLTAEKAQLQSNLDQLQANYDTLESQRDVLQASLATANATIDTHVATIADRNATIAAQATTISNLETTVAARDTTIAGLNTTLADRNATITDQAQTITSAWAALVQIPAIHRSQAINDVIQTLQP